MNGTPVSLSRDLPDPGFMAVAYQWALGAALDPVLNESDTTPGDFVRTMKQVMDLVSQLALLAPVPATQRVARKAGDALYRDLITISPVENAVEAPAVEPDASSTDAA